MIGDGPVAQLLAGLLVAAAGMLLGLLALWVAWSRRHWFLRFGALAGVLTLGLPIAAHDLIVTIFVGTVLILLVLMIGGRVARRRHVAIDPARSRFRFSMSDLLLGTVAIAVVLAMITQVPRGEWESWRDLLIAATAFAAITLVGAWAALGKASIWLRLISAAIACPAAGLALVTSRLLHRDTLIDVLGYAPYLHTYAPWYCLTGALTGGLMIVALALARRGNRSSRVLVGALFISLLLPLTVSYYRLLTPTPIPAVILPTPNGFDRLRQLGQKLNQSATVPDIDTATQAELAAFVTTNSPRLHEARTALNVPFKLPVTYTSLGELGMYGTEFRELARAFRAEGKLAELEGRTGDAIAYYMDGTRLGRGITRDGLMIDYLVGMSIEGIGFSSLSSLRGKLTAAQSCTLLHEVQHQFQPYPSPEPHFRREHIWQQHAHGWQERLAAVLRDFAGEEYSTGAVLVELHKREQAKLNLLCTELALRCFQGEQGRLPKTLRELTPGYLETELEDPFSGDPLVYRPSGTGFKLYSVGADLRDDGGKPSPSPIDPGDIILDPPPDSQ